MRNMTKTAAPRPPLIDEGHLRLAPAVQRWRRDFIDGLGDAMFAEAIFDRLPGVVFAVKDRSGRYVSISVACVERCGLSGKHQAIGRTAHDIFPRHMADRYARQDEQLFRTGRPIRDSLDLTVFPDKQPGWCLSDKFPLSDRAGNLVGLVCISRDLTEPAGNGLIDSDLSSVIDFIQANYAEPLAIPALARRAKLSHAQLQRRMKNIFGISAMQFLIKTRIEVVQRALATTDDPIAGIAVESGFCDQSTLSRQFKALTGLSPRQYRQLMRDGNVGE